MPCRAQGQNAEQNRYIEVSNGSGQLFQAELIVGYALKQGCSRAAILTVEDDDGIRLSEAFRLKIRSLAGQLVYNEGFPAYASTFGEYLETVEKNKELWEGGENITEQKDALEGALDLEAIQEKEKANGWDIEEPSAA